VTSELAARARDELPAVAARTSHWRFGQWYWGDAIAVDGLLDAEACAGLDLRDLTAQIDAWAAHAPATWDDGLAPGRAIFALGRRGRVSDEAVERAARAAARLPRTLEGVPLLRPHVPEWRHVVWVDSLYHLPAALAACPDAERSDAEAGALAVAMATTQLLRLPRGVAHCYDTGLLRSNGIAWTRGIGWALLGLLDLAAELEAKDRRPVLVEAERLLADLGGSQRQDGHWPTVLDDPEAETETSTAALFLTAALHEQATGIPVDRVVVDAAARAVLDRIDETGTYRGVSADTHAAWTAEAYRRPPTRPSPWGQGAALRALASLARVEA